MDILVTGATGKQGGAAARHLLGKGQTVHAMTRDPDSQAAGRLRALGAHVVQGDFAKPRTIEQRARDVDAVFLVTTPYENGPEGESEEGINALDACNKADVDRIVMTSVADADKDTGIPFFDSKSEVEKHLQDLGVPHTIVAPVWFRENLLDPTMTPGLEEGTLAMAMSGDTPLQNIEVDEIGRFVAAVFADPERFDGRRINIASDEVTPIDMADAIARSSGSDVEFQQVPLDELRAQNELFAKMFGWFEDRGYSVDIPALHQEVPEVEWRDFGTWAKDQDWRIQATVPR